jgi:ubiquinol-cytochrome c reductase cytochrome b subunit
MKTRLARNFTCAASIVFLGSIALLTLSQRPDAHAAEQKEPATLTPAQTVRLKELAQTKGISTAEATAILRKEAETNGPKLYQQNCADCHRYTDAKGKAFGSDDPTAPDLTGLGSSKWIAGWLDKKKIAGPAYFGNTSFEDGSMVDFVQSSLGDLLDELAEDDDIYETALEDLIACLTAEAKREGPRKADADEETVEGIDEDTVYLFEDLSCTECHRFYHLGDLGDGPDLTGYMSRDWLTGIIKNPEHERFYGSSNDGMPAHFESEDDPLMTQKEIETLVDYLRGTWEAKKLPPQ